jgi:hypothetical protein
MQSKRGVKGAITTAEFRRQLLEAKRLIVEALLERLEGEQVSRKLLARRMRTSYALVKRLMKPKDISVTLGTLCRAARALDARLIIFLQPIEKRAKRTVASRSARSS